MPPKKGRSRRNTYRKYKFKSQFEKKISDYLKGLGIDFDYEKLTLEYTQTRKYNPDFQLRGKSGDGKQIIIEAKGLFESEDRRKHLSVKAQHPERDIRFVFYADRKLYRGAKSTYGDWCNKNGFKWAVGTVPDEWLEELDITITKDGNINE